MNRNNAINVGVWAALLIVIAICGAIFNVKSILLWTASKTTTGTITQKLPSNHLAIMFSYEVKGRTYEGSGYAGQIPRTFGDIHLGDPVTVFYDERTPANSSLEAPGPLLLRSIGQILAISLIFSALGMCVLHRYQILPECSLFSKCRVQKVANPE